MGRASLVVKAGDPVVVVAPVGLHESGVDMSCGDGGGLVAYGMDEA